MARPFAIFVTTAIVLVTTALTTTLGPPATVLAQSEGNGLDETSVNTFLFDAAEGVVRVTVDVTLRNVTTDRVDGNVVRQTYWDSYYVAVPLGATNIVATRNGTVLSGELTTDPDFPAFSIYEFRLGRRLFSGDSTSVAVTYDHLGAGPRNEVPWRVNAAYATFVAFGIGDDEQVTINIVRPAGYEFDEITELEEYVESEPDGFGSVTFTRSGLDENFETFVAMSNDDRLLTTDLAVDDADITLRSWPDDPEWATFAADRIQTGIPALEELIGADWPNDRPFDVRQTVEPYLYGYAGWFDPVENEIAIGEDLDSDTMYHELSHAWFNTDLFDDRWLLEGFAQIYAAEVVANTGEIPLEPTLPDTTAAGGQPLAEWGSDFPTDDEETYGYNASFWVMHEIVDEIGFDRLRDVLSALFDDRSAYEPSSDAGPTRAGQNGWRRLLDLFELVASSEDAAALISTYVITEEDRAELDEREAARSDLTALVERADSWGLPLAVRSAMDSWSFDRAHDMMDAANSTLDRRDEIDALTTATDVDPPDLGVDDFAAIARDFTELDEALDRQIREGEQLVASTAELRELTDRLELDPPPPSDELFRERVDGFASAHEVVTDQLDAVGMLAIALEASDSEPGIFERVGLIGAGIDATVDDARVAVDAGDSDEARRLSAAAIARLEDANGVGTTRVTIAAASLLGLVIVGMIVRRRRRRRTRTESTAPSEGDGRESGSDGSAVAVSGRGWIDGDHDPAAERIDIVAGEHGGVHLDEDALAGAHLGGVDHAAHMTIGYEGQAPGASGVVERTSLLGDVGDPVFELDEDVVTVVDTDPVSSTEVLVDPDSEHGDER